jgi:hypothetical protein
MPPSRYRSSSQLSLAGCVARFPVPQIRLTEDRTVFGEFGNRGHDSTSGELNLGVPRWPHRSPNASQCGAVSESTLYFGGVVQTRSMLLLRVRDPGDSHAWQEFVRL